MAFPLAFPGEAGALLAAAVAAGAVVAFLALARQRLGRMDAAGAWGLAAAGTWLLAWAALGRVTTAAGWALVLTGAVVWAMALAPRRP